MESNSRHFIRLEAISGINLGIEVFLGDDLLPEDKFAICFDLFILRITYIIKH